MEATTAPLPRLDRRAPLPPSPRMPRALQTLGWMSRPFQFIEGARAHGEMQCLKTRLPGDVRIALGAAAESARLKQRHGAVLRPRVHVGAGFNQRLDRRRIVAGRGPHERCLSLP